MNFMKKVSRHSWLLLNVIVMSEHFRKGDTVTSISLPNSQKLSTHFDLKMEQPSFWLNG